jgi:diguanylate cyclase
MAYLDPKAPFAIKDRLRSWFEGRGIGADTASGEKPSWQQKVFTDVGDFLFDHRLDPTPNNYDLGFQFRMANNGRLVASIRDEISRTGVLDADAAERIFAEFGGPVSAEALSRFAERIEAQAEGLTTIATQSAGDAKDFSTALERECSAGGEVSAIVGLTQAMVARTRHAEAQLLHAQKQLNGLRSSLVDARRAADVDPLTDLPNRRAFKRNLEVLIEKSHMTGKPLSLGFCDIDHFKIFNDTHGHETGDRVLRYVAATLAQAFESRGIVGRFGGEEFLVALPDLPIADARDAIDATRKKLADRHLFAATDHAALGTVTFSAGVTMITEGDVSADLLRRADEALYRAKAAGRNCVVIG